MKFTLLFNYDPSLVSNPIEERSRLVTSIFDLLKKKYHMAMLHKDMNITRLRVYAQFFEEYKLKLLVRVFIRGRTTSKVNLCLRREFEIMMLLVLLRLMLRFSK